MSDLLDVDVRAADCSFAEVADTYEGINFYHACGASDGLPVIPATRGLVEAMLAETTLQSTDVLGQLPARKTRLTVLQAAICAVMAGAEPKHFPIVLGSWKALFSPEFNLNGVLTSSGGASIVGVVSGPGGPAAGMNSGAGLLGPGNRANASIGRAIRLGARNVFRARAGELDASSFGHAGKYTGHFAEEDPAPQEGAQWQPLRVREGFGSDSTTVSVMASEGPRQINHGLARDPMALVAKLAWTIAGAGRAKNHLVVLGPEHQQLLRSSKIEMDELVHLLSERSRITPEQLEQLGTEPAGNNPADPKEELMYPEDRLCVVTAGGPGAGWSVVIPSWGTGLHTRRVTREIES